VNLHYVALGDSTTVGVGDPLNGGTTDLSDAGARPGEWVVGLGARAFADELASRGVPIGVPPALACAGQAPSRWDDAVWMVKEGVPWLGRRARDLTPWAARMMLTHVCPAPRYPVPPDAEIRQVEA
jgi:hypothetical protein